MGERNSMAHKLANFSAMGGVIFGIIDALLPTYMVTENGVVSWTFYSTVRYIIGHLPFTFGVIFAGCFFMLLTSLIYKKLNS